MDTIVYTPDIDELKQCLKLEYRMFMEAEPTNTWSKARKQCTDKNQLKFIKDLRDMSSKLIVANMIQCLGVDKDILWSNYGKMEGCTISEGNKKPQDLYWCMVVRFKRHIGYTEMDVMFDEVTKKDLREMNRMEYFLRQMDTSLGYTKKPLELRPYKPNRRSQKKPTDPVTIGTRRHPNEKEPEV